MAHKTLTLCCVRALKRNIMRSTGALHRCSYRNLCSSRIFQGHCRVQKEIGTRSRMTHIPSLWRRPSLAFCTANPATESKPVIIITDATVNRMKALRTKRNESDLMLRIGVDAGGCSGFSYQFEFMNPADIEEDDLVMTQDTAQFVIDKVSLKFLKGAKLDFISDFIQRSFVVVDNPNIVSECGCNVSFAPNPDLLDDDDDEEQS